ncbi:Lipoprotein-releasing system ATP-binding protein LolD [Lacunisphaera limnophila]|uniref:Lipoprotein-releasing system ATP-binding protein LolD n=1 Tax=Lacunisphaera limnophila TaxID=1838286 RepID=A0A1D8AZV7_9BACT|nr:ABC transporter ATP-binding protein [Lacunisphaera limnophila]AOS46394.1 Lipoprotein-releasing system ATP-binding protein LolD [Lacunisphaera limnophila]
MSDVISPVLARNLHKSYDGGRLKVLQDVSLEVRPGELVALLGSSGSGKSTLLHLLGGLDVPDQGELAVCGLDPRDEVARLELRRRHLGFVFQLHNLIPDLTMAENIAVPALATGMDPAARQARIAELTARLGLGHRLTHRIQDLSGGERQRTAICRALMNSPRLLLADEPTGSLDEETGSSVFALIKELAERDGIAVVLATHERRFAEQCHRFVRMRNGRLSEE